MIQAVNLKERFPGRPAYKLPSKIYSSYCQDFFFFFNGILLLETNGISKYSFKYVNSSFSVKYLD